ncbi:MAG: heme exporter protein CcmD [Pseudomonadota bacterium]
MSHMVFVLFSYGAAALIMCAVLAWLWVDARATRTELARLEAQGVKRRSER